MTIRLDRRDKCPVCGEEGSTTLFRLPYSDKQLSDFLTTFYDGRIDLPTLVGTEFIIDECSNCAMIYQQCILDEHGATVLYSDWIDNAKSLKKKKTAKAGLFRQYAGQIETLTRLFPQQPHTINILEYGMGWGYWSRMAQAHGYSVQGLELAPERVEHARSMGIEVIDQLPAAGPHYHFIYANQVFEHLPRPLETLTGIAKRLCPDGIVYLRVPDGQQIATDLRKRGWQPEMDAIHPLEHINCFSRKTLIELGRRAGLTPVSVPIRLNLRSLRAGIRREIADRFVSPHVYFRRAGHITDERLTLK